MRDPSMGQSLDLAARTGASLVIVGIVAPGGDMLDVQLRKRRTRIRALVDDARREGVNAIAEVVVSGSPANALIKIVRDRAIDLVIKTARVGNVRRARGFSDIAKELMRTCPCPVWAVRGENGASPRIILAAVAPYHHAIETERLDRDVLEVAAQLVQLRDARLHIASVWRPIGAARMHHDVSGPDYLDYARSSELAARSALSGFLARYCPFEARVHMRAGRSGEAIAAIAAELDAELVVVGSAGRTGIKRWFLGNTVEDVFDESRSAVLGVRDVGLAASARIHN
jgi:nucleotide-binding universal stress UspA family protein